MSLLFNMLSRLVITFPSKEQASFNFMATVTICSDFGVPQNKVSHYFHCFPIDLPWSDGTGCHMLVFWNWVLSQLTLLFHFHQEAHEFFFTFCHKGDVICISQVVDVSPGNLDSSVCLAFCMMYFAYKLNKQDDNIQPWFTPFPIWNQSVVPCPILTVASCPAYRFLKRQGR